MSNIIISKTDSMIRQVKKTLRELENFRLKLEHPYSEDRFDHLLQAADAAEVTCLQLRQMLVACLSTTKEKLLDDIADAQGYAVEERNGVICIRTPALPLKKRYRSNCSYIAEPLVCVLRQYSREHEIHRLRDAIVTIRHNYPSDLPVRYIRDHDNIEVKKVLDVIGLYFLLEDNMAHCDLYYTAKASDEYFTEIFIAPKPENQGIIGGFAARESGVSDNERNQGEIL